MNGERCAAYVPVVGGRATRRRLLGALAGVAGLHLSEAAAHRRQRGGQRRGQSAGRLSAESKHAEVLIETSRGEIPEGDFQATGAIDDVGTFSFERVHFAAIGAPTFGIVPTLEVFTGQKGTFSLQNHIKFTLTEPGGDPDTVVFTVEGAWSVFKGTGAYERLHGHGRITGKFTVFPGGEEALETFTGTMFFA